MLCEFQELEICAGKKQIRCIRCGKSLWIATSVQILKAQCPINMTEGYQRYSVWQNDQTGWKFIWLDPAIASSYCYCPPDDSQAGTRLKKLFEKRGYTPKSCHCDYLANMFDQASLELLQKERERAVDLIMNSAKMMNVKVSRFVISMIFSYVLKREAARIRGNGKPSLPV